MDRLSKIDSDEDERRHRAMLFAMGFGLWVLGSAGLLFASWLGL